jgi:hypothetical protein
MPLHGGVVAVVKICAYARWSVKLDGGSIYA